MTHIIYLFVILSTALSAYTIGKTGKVEAERQLEAAKKGHVIVSICGHCKAYIGEKDGHGKSGVSHGICKGCAQSELRRLRLCN